MDSDFQKELTCFVCLNYLTDPITIDCRHSFCRHCLNLMWEKGTTVRCPICKEKTVQTELKTNILVKNLVSLARQAHLRQFLCSQEQMCGTHKETKTIFCEVSKNLLCVLCSNIQEHESHTHYSIEYAIEDYREKLLRQMRSIWKKIQENEINLKKESQITKDWRTFPPILFDENQHLKVLESEGKNIYEQLIKSEAAMGQKKKDLREMYEELMTMCHKSDVELLKSLGNLLTRSEFIQQHMPQPVNPALNARPIPGLIEKVKQFQVNILFEYEPCSKNCMLFGDVRHRSELQDVPFHSSRSNCFAAWGPQEFTSGKHYWEIDVNNSCNWAVGVSKDSYIRRNSLVAGSRDTFFLLCLKEGNHYNLLTTSSMIFQYVEKPLKCIGVFVDFDNKNVSFINVYKSSIIWNYLFGSFKFSLKPFFCTDCK